ncbi:TolC family protein [Aquifex aeolicus]|uniref:TolC family protein n=1 Tax=Aquifex aeolicus (strain VF5) TaxID=224324 RepID=O67180_AQUAE|nr:TolC family protein [Aquifex aeolicus]AAC07151.1 putative protein [Aquifex aeolicus VF5]
MKKLIFGVLLFSFSFSFDLEKIVKEAERNNPRLNYYFHRIKSKDFYLEQILSKYKPRLSASVYYGYQEFKPYLGEKKKATLKYFYTALEQPIFYPEVLQEYRQGKIEKEVERLYLEKYLQDFRYELLRQLLTYSYLKTKERLYKKVIKDRKKIIKILEKLLKKRISTEVELLVEKKKLEMDVSEYEKSKEEKKRVGKVLRFYLPEEEMEKIPSLNFPLEYSVYANLLKELSKKSVENVDIKIAQKQYENARYEVKKRKFERWPKLSLQLSYLYSSTTAVATVSRDKRAALILNVPIYSGGYYKARVAEALELEKASLYFLKSVEKEVKVSYEEGLKNLEKSSEDIKSYLKLLRAERELLEMYRVLFEKRVKSERDVLNQEISFLYREVEYLEKVYEFLIYYLDTLHTLSQIKPEEIKTLKEFFGN